MNYIKEKKDFLEKYDKNEIKKIKNETNEELVNYEKELEKKMKLELDEYKKELIQEYEIDDIEQDNSNNNGTKNLEIKKINLESQIKIQKERNNNKKEIQEQTKKFELEEKNKYLEEMNKIKISRLEQQNNNKINRLSDEYKNNFNIFVKEFQNRNNNNVDLSSNISIFNQKNDLSKELISQYNQELDTQLEESKNSLKLELELKYQKDLENLKFNLLSNDNDEQKENKENQNKIEETIKNLIEKISTEFNNIKTKETKEINISLKDIKEKIGQINSNNNDEEKGTLIEDYLSDIISEKKVLMSKFNSLVKMNEEEFIKNKYLIQFYITIIKTIIQNLSINKTNINIEEIFGNVNDIIKEYKMKYNKEINEKLFPVLYNAFDKILNDMFDDDKINNIIDNSIYGQSLFLGNNTMNMTNININSKRNESMMNNNNINKKRLFSSFSPRKNDISNNNILNKTVFNNNQRYILNKTNYNNNILNNTNIINNKEEESIININLNNINEDNINIPELKIEIIEKLSPDNIQKYNIIKDFLINESKKILDELSSYSEKKDSENKLNILFKSGEFKQYNNILNRICEEENDKTNQIFKILKNNINDNLAFIEKYYDKMNIVDSKFNQIMNNIEEYKNNFYGSHNIFGKKNNSYYKSYNTENMLNNTFNVYNRNNYINEQSFINTTHSIDFRNNKNFFI